MQKNVLETLMGAIVLIVAGAFMAFAYKGSQMQVGNGYVISAHFNNVSGIALGSDVRVGGIKVGVVSDMSLDNENYDAVLSMQINKSTQLPKDSSASIVSSGLLGDKYIQLTPGAETKVLKDGDKIDYTQSAINLEEMIGKFMFSNGGVDSESSLTK